MGPKLDYELFYKLLKLFLRDVQVKSLSQIQRTDLICELEYFKDCNSNIQLEIWISSKNFDWLWGLNLKMNFSINCWNYFWGVLK